MQPQVAMGRFGNRQYFYKKKGNQQASANDSGPHGQQASASQPSLHGQRSSDGSAAPQATSSGRGLTSLPEFNVCVSCMLKNYKVRVGKFTKGRKYCDECGQPMAQSSLPPSSIDMVSLQIFKARSVQEKTQVKKMTLDNRGSRERNKAIGQSLQVQRRTSRPSTSHKKT